MLLSTLKIYQKPNKIGLDPEELLESGWKFLKILEEIEITL